ncbi:MAG TPA: branched-chain amino acid ABC transporter permease [Burkholderiales bacterium]
MRPANPAVSAAAPARARRRLGVRHLAVAFPVLSLVFAGIGAALGETFYLRLATEALILAGLAISVDILLGYTGLLSLGQALYFGLGAYTAAFLLGQGAVGFWGALLASLALATPVALLAGLVAIRSKGVYFILITFGLAQVAAKAVYNTRELGGSDGLVGVPVLQADFGLFRVDLGSPVAFFLLMLALIMGLYAGLNYLMHTPFGRTLVAIRSNEHRVRFLGFDPWRYKLAAYVVAANVAALCGALYPMLRGFVSPELLYFKMSADAVITVILGGVGTLIGPIYGSVALVGLRTVLGSWTEHYHMIIGALFMLAVIFMPRGFAGLFDRSEGDPAQDEGEGT